MNGNRGRPTLMNNGCPSRAPFVAFVPAETVCRWMAGKWFLAGSTQQREAWAVAGGRGAQPAAASASESLTPTATLMPTCLTKSNDGMDPRARHPRAYASTCLLLFFFA